MKRQIVCLVVALLATVLTPRAEGPDDQYVRVYYLIQEADSWNEKGDLRQAIAKYMEAQSALKTLQVLNPDWNERVVNYRLDYIARKLDPLTQKLPPATAPPADAPAEGTLASLTAATNQFKALQDEIARLAGQNALLEAKLKEALSVQPAAVDPRELNKAQERIKTLEKERDLLKVSLEQDHAKAPNLPDPALLAQERQILAEVKQKLAQQTERSTSLERETQDLRQQLSELKLKTPGAPSAGQQELALAEFRQRLAQQTNFIAVLQAENQSLKQQMAESKVSAGAPASSVTNLPSASAEATITALQASNVSLRTEQILLESRLAEMIRQTKPLSPGKAKDVEKQLAAVRSTARELERERDALEKKLTAANKELAKKESRATPAAAPSSDLQKQLEVARARLDIYEAKQVPYTAEELALFKQPAIKVAALPPTPAANAPAPKSNDPPPGAGPLIAEAERAIASGRYADAEAKFLLVLRQDQKNVRTLANLAAVQLDQNRLEDAEKTLKQALAVDSQSAPSLFLLGDLRFRQEKYDEALQALSLSAKINPDKAETQYYLGKTLIQKGSRQSAETALRRAVQLKPGWGDAHYLLAVVYATQQPPFKELAQWHYQKAVDSGAPRNGELEKMIAQAAVTGSNQ